MPDKIDTCPRQSLAEDDSSKKRKAEVLRELDEIASELEDSGHIVESTTIHDVFLKIALNHECSCGCGPDCDCGDECDCGCNR